jgi:hypothetical protein
LQLGTNNWKKIPGITGRNLCCGTIHEGTIIRKDEKVRSCNTRTRVLLLTVTSTRKMVSRFRPTKQLNCGDRIDRNEKKLISVTPVCGNGLRLMRRSCKQGEEGWRCENQESREGCSK